MIRVTKANGDIEPFSREKVLDSIRRAGVPRKMEGAILSHIESNLYDTIPTFEIYQYISEFLGKSDQPYHKARYSLKQSIMLLGPSGYPFEDFVSRILEVHGYETKVRQIMMGKCVSHEIDVVARKDNKTSMIEAKFHNNPGNRSDLHVVLYTKARFDDVKDKNNFTDGWLVTNTKTTSDAITYAQCTGMRVISWSYPTPGSLRDLIEEAGLHPITILTSLSQSQKITLLQNHVIMCKDIQRNHSLLDILFLSDSQKQNVFSEVAFICKSERG